MKLSPTDWGEQIKVYTLHSALWQHIVGIDPSPSWWDEDLARCLLHFSLSQGSILKIKRKPVENIISIDGRVLRNPECELLMRDIIEPIVDKLKTEVYGPKTSKEKEDMPHLPGITKIKIKAVIDRWGVRERDKWGRRVTKEHPANLWVIYTANHKLGRDGGRNYHVTGTLNSLKINK